MKIEITVKEALKKGKIQLIYIPMIIMISLICFSLAIQIFNLFHIWVSLVFMVLAFVLSWLYWALNVANWKIWAYQNVRNVHELKKKAIEDKLIYEDYSISSKFEIVTKNQKEKLKQLEYKFDTPDFYRDDISVPKKTEIYYSKKYIFFENLFGISALTIGIIGFYDNKGEKFLILFILVFLFTTYRTYKKLILKKPVIIIDNKGIKINNKDFYKWENIYNERIVKENQGEQSNNYLIFNDEKVLIAGLDTNYQKLEHLLHVYRLRYEKEKH